MHQCFSDASLGLLSNMHAFILSNHQRNGHSDNSYCVNAVDIPTTKAIVIWKLFLKAYV